MKIVIPELGNPIIQAATREFPEIEFLGAADLPSAVEMVRIGAADSMLSGIDYSSRDVLLAYRDGLPLKSEFFSSCFICQREGMRFALADGGVNKQPSKEQLRTIVEDSAYTFSAFTGEQPRIAMLSYSTNGSGGKNTDLEKIDFTIDEIRTKHPDWVIDGEMQLDAAIDPVISDKKFPDSRIRGSANIFVTPDLNSGNIFYKSLEYFGGFVCAGPIIQGFVVPVADLSRGSTINDVILTIKVLKELL